VIFGLRDIHSYNRYTNMFNMFNTYNFTEPNKKGNSISIKPCWNQRYISTAKLQQTSNLQIEICKTLLSVLLLPSPCFRYAIIFGFCNRWLRARKLNKPSRQPGLFVSNRLLSAIFPAKAIIIVEEGKSLRILIYTNVQGSELQMLIILYFSKVRRIK